jgi:hypothetical protein
MVKMFAIARLDGPMIRENSAVRGKRKIAKCSQIVDTPSESTVVTTIHRKSAEYFVCLAGSNSGPDSFALVSNNYFSWRSAIPALSAFTSYIRGLPQRRTAAVGMNVNSETNSDDGGKLQLEEADARWLEDETHRRNISKEDLEKDCRRDDLHIRAGSVTQIASEGMDCWAANQAGR